MNATEHDLQLQDSGEVGLVEPVDFHHPHPYEFISGRSIPEFTLRYETYGRLNADKNNAILIAHALTGDHHCAGVHSFKDRKPGWWNNMIGPGKPIDTERFFVICINCIGGCQGSTGPKSINPETGKPYNLTFPFVTITDMVRTQKLLLDSLGVTQLHAIVGGSMGGMQTLQWAIEYPDYVQRILPMATTWRQNSQAIAFDEVGRQAIMQDPEWKEGNYEPDGGPAVGLAIARMMAHITYLSDKSLDRKFGRRRQEGYDSKYSFDIEFEVESYLRYQGASFTNRFDANTYLYFTRALGYFDLAGDYGSLDAAVANMKCRALLVGFTSDWLFPPAQNRDVALAMLRQGKEASYVQIDTDLGHDSFLVDSPELFELTRDFLE
ncbi:homoserine O-acetyltransferase [Pelagicoccus sp. SDUM812003]|uniref:homoserine O-acetyltransferase MetX n=1 Tax=Pelagicoccus sp. SDUM812003 TaxID=3041267 RepID=UPI00280F5E9C|nr:homoserine O-acetyltransferase [Pelagicoccus sp. SDUM812003]MDQ8204259.1 homoserine O-acetyltransferase [Pelagicoccus sp. SDUM812003]